MALFHRCYQMLARMRAGTGRGRVWEECPGRAGRGAPLGASPEDGHGDPLEPACLRHGRLPVRLRSREDHGGRGGGRAGS
eukprot:12649671-Alexandrium_andersonii.AAC.1